MTESCDRFHKSTAGILVYFRDNDMLFSLASSKHLPSSTASFFSQPLCEWDLLNKSQTTDNTDNLTLRLWAGPRSPSVGGATGSSTSPQTDSQDESVWWSVLQQNYPSGRLSHAHCPSTRLGVMLRDRRTEWTNLKMVLGLILNCTPLDSLWPPQPPQVRALRVITV